VGGNGGGAKATRGILAPAAGPGNGWRQLVRTHFQVWGKPNHLGGGSGVAR